METLCLASVVIAHVAATVERAQKFVSSIIGLFTIDLIRELGLGRNERENKSMSCHVLDRTRAAIAPTTQLCRTSSHAFELPFVNNNSGRLFPLPH